MKKIKERCRFLQVYTPIKYYEDTMVNGAADTKEDPSIPCIQDNGIWAPLIDLESGKILNWKDGATASIFYKVKDSGEYDLLDEAFEVVVHRESYVPVILQDPSGDSDYISLLVGEDGTIINFRNNKLEDFKFEELERIAELNRKSNELDYLIKKETGFPQTHTKFSLNFFSGLIDIDLGQEEGLEVPYPLYYAIDDCLLSITGGRDGKYEVYMDMHVTNGSISKNYIADLEITESNEFVIRKI